MIDITELADQKQSNTGVKINPKAWINGNHFFDRLVHLDIDIKDAFAVKPENDHVFLDERLVPDFEVWMASVVKDYDDSKVRW